MASPGSNAEVDEREAQNNLEQITFRFCSECSNMLYPKEDEESHKLQFTCRTCQYTEEATSTCVFRNLMNNTAGATAGVTQDVGSDPTVCQHIPSRPSASSPASHALAASQDSERQPAPFPRDDSSLAVCLRCGNVLLQCSKCKDPATIDEYNDFVRNDPNFAAARSLGIIRNTSHWNALDGDGRDAWDSRFTAPTQIDMKHVAQESIAHYLPTDPGADQYDDPPEALGIDPENYDHAAELDYP